jgi:hypothetical protein
MSNPRHRHGGSPDRYVTEAQAADYLGVTPQRLRQLAAAHGLESMLMSQVPLVLALCHACERCPIKFGQGIRTRVHKGRRELFLPHPTSCPSCGSPLRPAGLVWVWCCPHCQSDQSPYEAVFDLDHATLLYPHLLECRNCQGRALPDLPKEFRDFCRSD